MKNIEERIVRGFLFREELAAEEVIERVPVFGKKYNDAVSCLRWHWENVEMTDGIDALEQMVARLTAELAAEKIDGDKRLAKAIADLALLAEAAHAVTCHYCIIACLSG